MRSLVGLILLVTFSAGCESNPDVTWQPGQENPRPPSAPRIVATVERPGSVEVSWLANEAADEVTSYSVLAASTPWTNWTVSLADATTTSTAGCCSLQVTGLRNDETYWFAVRASNIAGDGPESSQLRATPPGWTGTALIDSPLFDTAEAVAVDSAGNVFVAGWTSGVLPGQSSLGSGDMFVARYDAAGNRDWLRQLGSSAFESAFGIAITPAGQILVGGGTGGTLPGESPLGGSDIALILLDPSDGSPVWFSQLGTAADDTLFDLVSTTSGAFIAGGTNGDFAGQTNAGGEDAFLAKVDTTNGSVVWGRLVGSTAQEYANGLTSAPDGSLFLCGVTGGAVEGSNAGSIDAFVTRFSSAGVRDWTDQFGTTGADYCSGIAASATGVYAVGDTPGNLDAQTNPGMGAMFIRKWSGAGAFAWTRLLGGSGGSGGAAAHTSPQGVFAAGSDETAAGSEILVVNLDATNQVIWQSSYGSLESDSAIDIAVSPQGAIYTVGITQGPLGGNDNDEYAAFLVKFSADGAVDDGPEE